MNIIYHIIHITCICMFSKVTQVSAGQKDPQSCL